MHFDLKRRRLILALALVELAIVGTMITAVTWRSESMTASAAPGPEGGTKPRSIPHQVVKVGDAPHVQIDARGFAVEVVTGDEHRVVFDDLSRHTGVVFSGKHAVDISSNDGDLKIVVSDSNSMNLGLSDHRLRIVVPKSTNLEITDCGSASIADVAGEVHVTANNGGVSLQNILASIIEVEANNGRVEAKGIETRSLTIHGSNGRVIAENVAIAGEDAKLDLKASNGKIEFTGRLAPGGEYTVEGSNGSVSVTLPSDADTTVTASVSNGSVHASNGITVNEDGENKTAKYGEGRGALSVSTSNGSVYLARTERV